MSATLPNKTLTVSIESPAGLVEVSLSVPDGFIPLSDLVSPLQKLGDRVQLVEVQSTLKRGRTVSCKEGCAACCRMMIPVSPPEAIALWRLVKSFPAERRKVVLSRIDAIQNTLRARKIFEPLHDLTHSSRQFRDEDIEPLNLAYYALRMPCPFLEDESCSIYTSRPSACRELLVTSPPEFCQDMVRNPVAVISIPLRISTLLSTIWAQLLGGPTRLIPMPFALDWAEKNQGDYKRRWEGKDLVERALRVALEMLKRFFRESKPTKPDS
jgi:Fe-S-cluster containining protein